MRRSSVRFRHPAPSLFVLRKFTLLALSLQHFQCRKSAFVKHAAKSPRLRAFSLTRIALLIYYLAAGVTANAASAAIGAVSAAVAAASNVAGSMVMPGTRSSAVGT